MSTQPPQGPQPDLPPPGTVHCPRCSSAVGPDQDWCLECGAPARTRLAQTPNWQLPTAAIAAIVLVAGAMLAFAFVRLTDDGGAPAGAAPVTAPTAAPIVPTVTPPPGATTPPAIVPTTGATGPTGATGTPATTATTPPRTQTTGTTPTTTPSRSTTSTTATGSTTTTQKEP